jgi:hypothetical protein
MTDPKNTTADDTTSAAAGPPEASSVATPAEAVAPDVQVSEITAAEGGIPADASPGDDASADDFNPEAAAPEPTD